MTDQVKVVLHILDRSQRPMPAHFCGNSFMIDLDGFSGTNDEYEMANVAWHDTEGIKIKLDKEDAMKVIKLGEDVMLGSFILAKTVDEENLPSEVASLKQILQNRFRALFESSTTAQNILDESQEYIDYCSKYGMKRALVSD